MPVANNSGTHINYEITGDGPPLILQHGLTSKLDKWNWYGYVDELKRSYRVISVDARGHGKSDKPYDASLYDRKIMASDIVSVMDRENIDMAHYMGYSMGGSIGFGLAEAFPQRFYSLIIGGMHPYPLGDLELEPGVKALDFMLESLEHGMDVYVGGLEPVPDERELNHLLSNDAKAITAATLALRDRPDISGVLPTMTMPCLVYCGDQDSLYPGAEECVKHMPNVTWISLPGFNHGDVMERSDALLPHVLHFLSDD
ncbi:MAG: hypothetical protein CL894_00285 [Dehalococcoidia bacterium]|nr:hypothetical protein [Dehalococcoidia bacterium]